MTAISGRRASVYATTSTPIAFPVERGTWNTARTQVSFSTQFWHDSLDYPVVVMPNGILAGATMTGAAGNKIQVAAGTCYLNGVSTTVTATSVTGLVVATTAGKQIIYAIVVTTAGAYGKIAGVTGVASTTRGTAGGPPTITDGSIVVGYVTRVAAASTTIASTMISITNHDAQERAFNPGPSNIRAVSGKVDFLEALDSIHTSGAKRVYVSGYHHAGNFKKVATLTDWKLDVKREREDKTTQNSEAPESDPGRVSYGLSFNRFIEEAQDDFFDQLNDLGHDWLVKLYPTESTTKYYACQAGFDLSGDFAMAGKVKQGVTATVTGRVEKFG